MVRLQWEKAETVAGENLMWELNTVSNNPVIYNDLKNAAKHNVKWII